jgi:hypothetical protein
MSNVSRGLFDPRKKFQSWPEPNDDPNIPYVWGLSGYSRSNPPEGGTEETEEAPNLVAPLETPKDIKADPVISTEAAGVIFGVSATLAVIGVFEGISESKSESVAGRLSDGLLSGILYATGVGYFGRKYMR